MGYGDNIRLYFDLVTTNLYDIEVVLLEVVHWGRSVNDSIIDLTCFKKLKTFIYSAGDIEDDDQNYADNQENDFVLLKYINGEEDCYYLDEEKRKKVTSRVW